MNIPDIEDIYQLSPLQQGMLFHTLYEPESEVYFEQDSYPVYEALNVRSLAQAWQQVADRHPVLRTSFHWEGLDEPLQVVHRHVKLPLELQDWRDLTASEQ